MEPGASQGNGDLQAAWQYPGEMETLPTDTHGWLSRRHSILPHHPPFREDSQ